MKIIHIISCLDFGGAQKILLGLATEAVNNGHDIEVISIYGSNIYEDEFRKKEIPITVLTENKSVNLKNIFKLIGISNRLVKALSQKKPEVIHVHLFIPKLLLLINKFRIKAPVIQTQHDNSPWWGRHNLMDRVMTKVEEYFSVHIAMMNVAISKSVQNDLISNFGLSPEKTPCIYNFVEDYPYSSKEKRSCYPFKVFLISRLDWEKKGLGVFIETADHLINQLRCSNIQLVVVGDGPDRKRMENEVRQRELSNYFHFRGYQQDIYLQYYEADVIMIPSRWEGFGLTAAEAAMAGVPVVGSSIGGLKEVVEIDKSGYLHHVGDSEGFSKSILKLHDNPELYSQMSAYAKQRAQQLYNKKRVYQKYETLYQSLKES